MGGEERERENIVYRYTVSERENERERSADSARTALWGLCRRCSVHTIYYSDGGDGDR